ncbi:MAG: oligosaccharide flippase family protein [Pseudomonadota bacterium]
MNSAVRKLLPKSSFARGVSVLVGGTAGAQALMVLASPVLTRLYSPEDFGLLAVYAGLLATFAAIVCLCYEQAIPLPENDRDGAAVSIASLFVVLITSALCAILVWSFGGRATDLLNSPALAPYLWLLPVGVFLTGIYQVFSLWAVRTKEFPTIARTNLLQAFSGIAVQLVGYTFGPIALIVGTISTRATGSTALMRQALATHGPDFRSVNLKDIYRALLRWRRFPAFSTWARLANTAGSQLPPILFAALFNPIAAGLYMLAHRVLQVPVTVLGQSVAQVFFTKAVEAKRAGLVAPLIINVHGNLANIALPAALLLILTGPEIFEFVFGSEWARAGRFAQLMAPWLYLVFISGPISNIVSIMEQQAVSAIFNVAQLAMRIAAIMIGAWFEDLMLAVTLYAIGNAVHVLIYLSWIFVISGVRLRAIFFTSFRAFLNALVICSPTIATMLIGGAKLNIVLSFFVSSVLLVVFYALSYRKLITR